MIIFIALIDHVTIFTGPYVSLIFLMLFTHDNQ